MDTGLHPLRKISIHALREEGDVRTMKPNEAKERFLSTPSARRATCREKWNAIRREISIHALREEGDATDQSDSLIR